MKFIELLKKITDPIKDGVIRVFYSFFAIYLLSIPFYYIPFQEIYKIYFVQIILVGLLYSLTLLSNKSEWAKIFHTNFTVYIS